MTETTQEFQNEKIQLKVAYEPNCIVKFDITVTPEETKAIFSKAVKAINKEVSLPGFRKGHAPDKLITQHYSKYIEDEWKRLVSLTTLEQACKLSNIQPFSEVRVPAPSFKQLSQEKGAELTYTLEREPLFSLPNPNAFQLAAQEPKSVSEKDEERELRSLQFNQTQWEPIDRAVQVGDYIDVDIDTLESPPVSLCRESRFQVSEGMMPAWMQKLVLGLNPGEFGEGVSEKDESTMDGASLSEFKPTHCRVTVKAIFTTELPPINDELARKVGAQDLDDLKQKVRHRLENEARTEVERNLLTQLISQLFEKFPIDVPASIIEYETAIKEMNLLNAVSQDNDSETMRREKTAAAKAAARAAGEEWAKLTLFGSKYAKVHQVPITQGDLYTEWLVQSKGFKPPLEMTIEASMNPEQIQRSLYMTVVTIKALRHLLEEVQKGSHTPVESKEST